MIRRGVLWDMDGVLVDTGDFHHQAWSEALSVYGLPFNPELSRATFGMNNAGILTTRLIRVPPRQCIDVEDALVGIQVAKRAGMKCVAVTTTSSADSLKAADIVVERLDALPIDTVELLLTEVSIA